MSLFFQCFVIFVSVLWTLSNLFVSHSCIDILVWPLPQSNPARSLWLVFPLIFFQPCVGWVTRELPERLGQVKVSAGLLTHLYLIAGTRMGTNGTSRGFRPGINDVWDFLTVTSSLPSREWNFTNCFMDVQFKECTDPQDFTYVNHHKNSLTYL